GAHGLLGIVLVGQRITKIYEDTVAHVSRHETIEPVHDLGDAFLIRRDDLAQVLRVHADGERRRTDQIREHHRDLAALGGVVGFRLRYGDGYQGRDRLQQLLAMAERRDADVLEIVVCQLAEQLAVDVVGAENLGILSETDPAEPIVDVQVQPPPGLLSAAVFEKLESLAPTVIPRGFLNQLGFAMWTPTTRQKYSRTVTRYQTDLTDTEWRIIAPHLPKPCATGRPREWPMREIVNGIFYVMRAGCPWRLVPSDLPPWGTIYRWFAAWRDDGRFERI